MTCAFRPSSPSSNTWNRPHGPAPTMTTSVSIGWRSNLSAESLCEAVNDTRSLRDGRGLNVLVEAGCIQEAFLGKPFATEQTRLILRAVVTQDGDDRVPGAEPTSE